MNADTMINLMNGIEDGTLEATKENMQRIKMAWAETISFGTILKESGLARLPDSEGSYTEATISRENRMVGDRLEQWLLNALSRDRDRAKVQQMLEQIKWLIIKEVTSSKN
jgi:hypothetical protein